MHTWGKGDEDKKLRASWAVPVLSCPSLTIVYIMTFSQDLNHSWYFPSYLYCKSAKYSSNGKNILLLYKKLKMSFFPYKLKFKKEELREFAQPSWWMVLNNQDTVWPLQSFHCYFEQESLGKLAVNTWVSSKEDQFPLERSLSFFILVLGTDHHVI